MHILSFRFVFSPILIAVIDEQIDVWQAVDVYWGVELADRDDACVQALRMSLLDECIRTSTGPCFVVRLFVFFVFSVFVGLLPFLFLFHCYQKSYQLD